MDGLLWIEVGLEGVVGETSMIFCRERLITPFLFISASFCCDIDFSDLMSLSLYLIHRIDPREWIGYHLGDQD